MNTILKTIIDNLTVKERDELINYLKSSPYKGNITKEESSMLKCPRCGSTDPIIEGYSTTTAVYYPPVWENGVNINPDGNVTTTKYTCGKCECNFSARYQHGKLLSISELE